MTTKQRGGGGSQALSNDDRVMKHDIGEDLLIKLFILAQEVTMSVRRSPPKLGRSQLTVPHCNVKSFIIYLTVGL